MAPGAPEAVSGRAPGLLMRGLRAGLSLGCALLAMLVGVEGAVAEQAPFEASGALRCVPGTGSWSVDGEGAALRGALCAVASAEAGADDAACADFTNLRFDAAGAMRAQVASTPPALRACERPWRWQGAVGELAIYHDGEALRGVDLSSLKLVWQRPAAKPYEVEQRDGLLVMRAGDELLVLVAGEQGAPAPLIERTLEGFIGLTWQEARLVLLEREAMTWWPLDEAGHPQVRAARTERFDEPLNPAVTHHALSDAGLLRATSDERRVAWHPFEGATRSIGLYGVQTFRAVAGSRERVTALVTENSAAVLYGVMGGGINNQAAVIRYWRLDPEQFDGPMILVAGARAVIAGQPSSGRSSPSARLVELVGERWRVETTLIYPTDGALLHLTPRYLLTHHPEGAAALAIWDLDAGSSEPTHTVARDALNRTLGALDAVEGQAPGADGTRLLLRGAGGSLASVDLATGALEALVTPPAGEDVELGARRALGQGRHVVPLVSGGPDAPRVQAWRLIDLGAARDLTLTPEGALFDAFDTQTRWFGYCIQGAPCGLSMPSFERRPGADAFLIEGVHLRRPEDRSIELALVAIGGTLLLFMLVVAWRLDWRRRATYNAQSLHDETLKTLTPLDIVIDDTWHVAELRPGGRALIGVERATLRLTDEVFTLEMPNARPLSIPLTHTLRARLTRQADPLGAADGGLLTFNIGSSHEVTARRSVSEIVPPITFDVVVPDDLRVVERVTYMDLSQELRTTWAAFEPLREALRTRDDVASELYRSPMRKAHDNELAVEPPYERSRRQLLDALGRRYVTPRDNELFIHRRWTRWPWRLVASTLVAIGVVSAVALMHLRTEPLRISLLVGGSLALPAAALTWVLMSWGMWNRLHLLRFGVAVEGKWVRSGVLRYSLVNGESFIMRSGLVSRSDFVPIILYDPARPRFAVQFTAHRDLGLLETNPPRPAKRSSRSFDAGRLIPVLCGLGVMLYVGVLGFTRAFPEPLADYELQALTAEHGEAMLEPCLLRCGAFADERRRACEVQCAHRQLRFVLARGGLELEHDPELTPGELRRAQLARTRSLVETLRAADGSARCDELASRVAAAPRWSVPMETVFSAAYTEEASRAIDPQLVASDEALRALQRDFFLPLCEPSVACREAPSSCPEPPTCAGDVTALWRELCALAPAARPLEPPSAAP